MLEKTQHIIGGFGKMPGDPPGSYSLQIYLLVTHFVVFDSVVIDLLHSYMGLAALACMREPGLKSIDPALCISVSAREHLESLVWRRGGEATVENDAAATSGTAT